MDKATLLTAAKAKTLTVSLDGIGNIVVRPLTRAEALTFVGKEMDVQEVERLALSFALVDPAMSPEDVAEWQEVGSAGDIQKVSDAVMTISGLQEGSPKSAYKSAGD